MQPFAPFCIFLFIKPTQLQTMCNAINWFIRGCLLLLLPLIKFHSYTKAQRPFYIIRHWRHILGNISKAAWNITIQPSIQITCSFLMYKMVIMVRNIMLLFDKMLFGSLYIQLEIKRDFVPYNFGIRSIPLVN